MPKTSTSAKKHTPTTRKTNTKNPLTAVALSAVVGTVLLLCSSVLFSFILKDTSCPESFFAPVALLCVLISGCGAGITAALCSGNPMPYSLISGILLLLMFLAISAAFDSAQVDSDNVFKGIVATVAVASSLVSGMLSTRKKGKKIKARR